MCRLFFASPLCFGAAILCEEFLAPKNVIDCFEKLFALFLDFFIPSTFFLHIFFQGINLLLKICLSFCNFLYQLIYFSLNVDTVEALHREKGLLAANTVDHSESARAAPSFIVRHPLHTSTKVDQLQTAVVAQLAIFQDITCYITSRFLLFD